MLPWSAFWERNYFAITFPVIQPFLTNNFVRGAVTGLGVVNLLAGFIDLAMVFISRSGPESAPPGLMDHNHRP